ncbi:MAG: hypothetical protein JXA93_22720 [Anaerolineae bacterium]|nr:hypothetical protein [Anaerolineae bacterium]
MTKRRASIRGRGAEILFGEPADVEIQPRAPGEMEEPGPQEPEIQEPEALEPWAEDILDKEVDLPATASYPSDPPRRLPTTTEIETPPEWEVEDIESALRAEALDGAPRSLARGVSSVLDVTPPLTAEMEVAFIEEAYAAGPPPEPVVEVPVPSMEETVEERTLEEDVAMMYELPPAEVGSVTTGVVPPRPERRFLEMEPQVALARDIQAPEKKVELIVLPERPLTDEERAEIVARLGEGWIETLQSQIDAAYESVRRIVGENEAVAVDAYNTLLKARDILVMRKIDQLAQAEYYLELVRARMKRVSASESAAKKYQWRILAWGMFWGIAFLVLLILLGQDWFRNIVAPAGEADSLIELDIFVSAMLWGGVGGAVAVLYSLFKHVGERDFDSQFLVSYVGKPFLGFISGAIIYMAFNLVIRALGIFPAGTQTAEGDVVPAVAPGVVYLVALAAGFKEARLLALIDSLWDQIFRNKEKEEEEVPEPTPAA